MKLLPLEGLPSYFALQAFHKLMLGLKMLPAYLGESYEEFYQRVEAMPVEDQEKFIREAALFVNLEREEIYSVAGFATDSNGVPYTAENMKRLSPEEIHEIIVAVCMKIASIKVNFVSETEKKNSKISA